MGGRASGMGYEVAVLTAEPDGDGEFSASFSLAEDASADTYHVNARACT